MGVYSLSGFRVPKLFIVILKLLRLFYSDEQAQYAGSDESMLLNFPGQEQAAATLFRESSMTKEDMDSRFPVVRFGDYVDRMGIPNEQMCVVCLSCLERSHEIRELSSCFHVFHKECLDSWVVQCQITCPICRTELYPFRKAN